MLGVDINNSTSLFFELGCFHRVQYKFHPALEHLLLISLRSWADGADSCGGAGCGARGENRDNEGTGVFGRHGRLDSDRQSAGRGLQQQVLKAETVVVVEPLSVQVYNLILQSHSIVLLLRGFTDSQLALSTELSAVLGAKIRLADSPAFAMLLECVWHIVSSHLLFQISFYQLHIFFLPDCIF